MSETWKMYIWMGIALIDTLIIIHDTYYKDTYKGGNRGYDRNLFIVSKGNTRIQLTDKVSALHLVSTLAALECTEPITSSKISGCKDYGDVYEVCFLDKAIRIAGQREAEQVLNWMLTYGCTKVSIAKINKEEIQNE